MFISQKCFKDKTMVSIIRRNNQMGKCDFCDLDNTYVIDMEDFCQEYREDLYQVFQLYEYEYKDKYLPQNQLQKDLEALVRLRKNIKLNYDSLLNLLQKNWNFFDLDVISEQKTYEVLVYWYNKINHYKPLEINDLKDKHWFDMRYKYWGYFVKEDWEFIRLNRAHNFRYNPDKIPKITCYSMVAGFKSKGAKDIIFYNRVE